MRATDRIGLRLAVLSGLSLTLASGIWAQSSGTASSPTPANTPAAQAPSDTNSGSGSQSTTTQPSTTQPSSTQPAATQPTSTRPGSPSAQPAPGSQPVGGDQPLPPKSGTASTSGNSAPCQADTDKKKKVKENDSAKEDDPEPGTTPIADPCNVKVDPDKVVDPGSEMQKVKPGSIEDVSAVGNREIGKRGLGNWYSTDGEIKMGKQYADEIEKSTRFITDPVVVEYVNRIGQNIVKNSDCKVPFTIKVIDSDEINAMALPGGFFYVNSGLILAADEEAELAGVMAHETAHVCAHHAAREMTRMNIAQISMIPLMIMLPYDWTGYGIYEAAQLAIPITFLQFSRDFEAQADYLGVQYMYRAGYDPQAFITFFEKIQALEKRKPGLVAKAFSDHPQTPDRILHSQEEIARILPAKQDYLVTTSEFDDVKARLARIENKRRLTDTKGVTRPSLRRASTDGSGSGSGSGSSSGSGSTTQASDGSDSGDGPPTLHRRDDNQN
jgi:beta-barrel assembly-enhancing protease